MSLKFYDIAAKYIAFLKTFERQIPNFGYQSFEKFVCGIVLSIGEYNYFAPVSSFNEQQHTNFLILDKGRPISSIRFCFMFPVLDEALKLKDFSGEPQTYQDLLNAEVRYCNEHREVIGKIAEKVYKIGANRSHSLAYLCCDFKLLELKCKEFRQQ